MQAAMAQMETSANEQTRRLVPTMRRAGRGQRSGVRGQEAGVRNQEAGRREELAAKSTPSGNGHQKQLAISAVAKKDWEEF